MTDIPQSVAEIADLLAGLPGTVAVVLGGSRAVDGATRGSDWDLGLYYRGEIDLTPLSTRGTVFPPGSWGRVMNGGAWLRRFVAGTPFPLLRCGGFLVAILAACRDGPRAVSQAGADSAQAELERAVVWYYQAMSARNWPAYGAHFWPQATLTTVWQPPGEPAPRVVITSIESFLAQTAQGPDSKPIFEERLLSQESRISGNLAQVWAHYAARFGDSTSVATWRGIDAFTWLKHEGQWRIVALAYIDEPDSKRGAP